VEDFLEPATLAKMFAIGNRIPIAATLDDSSSDGPKKAPRADPAGSSGVDD
jgi:hypothetical protein